MTVLQIAGRELPYDTLEEIRHRMAEISPNLTRFGTVETANFVKESDELLNVCFPFTIYVTFSFRVFESSVLFRVFFFAR